MDKLLATGFEFEPQADGTVAIEFYDDNGNIISTQAITGNAFLAVPLAAFVTTAAMKLGPEVAKKLVHILRAAEEEVEDGLQ